MSSGAHTYPVTVHRVTPSTQARGGVGTASRVGASASQGRGDRAGEGASDATTGPEERGGAEGTGEEEESRMDQEEVCGVGGTEGLGEEVLVLPAGAAFTSGGPVATAGPETAEHPSQHTEAENYVLEDHCGSQDHALVTRSEEGRDYQAAECTQRELLGGGGGD